MKLKIATEHDKEGGWTLDYDLLKTIREMVERYDFAPSMEGVELVLLAFHNMPLPQATEEDLELA